MAFTNSRIRALIELADNSDYEKAKTYEGSMNDTFDEGTITEWQTNGTTASTFTLSHLATIDWLFVENLDSTNFCELKFTTGAGTTDAVMDLQTGDWVVLTDITVASNLVVTADTAAVKLAIAYSGS